MKQTLSKGTRLGAYTIIRLVGRGGMGEVYEAYEHRLRRQVALKIIAPTKVNNSDEEDLVRRFIQEAHTLARINHPNVVTIYTIDKVDGVQFMAMEFVDGVPFKSVLTHVALSADEAAPFFLQMLEGLRILHIAQILHRDLKPNNLMVRPDGQIKVLDFGIAKRLDDGREQTATGVIVGTLSYLAPEVLAGKRADLRSDLWSLGAIFYECLTGQPLVSMEPKKIRGVRATPDSDVVFPESTLAWIPEEMRTIVGKLCDGRPQMRFADSSEAIEAIKHFQQQRPPLPIDFNRSFANLLTHLGNPSETQDADPIGKRALACELLQRPSAAMQPTAPSEKIAVDPTAVTIVMDSVVKRSISRRRHQQFGKRWLPHAGIVLSTALLIMGIISHSRTKAPPLKMPTVLSAPAFVSAAPTPVIDEPLHLIGSLEQNFQWVASADKPTLTWSRSLNENEFEVQVAADAHFRTIVLRDPAHGNNYQPQIRLAEGTYYWRLAPLKSDGAIIGPARFSVAYLSPVELTWPARDQELEFSEYDSFYELNVSWQCKFGAHAYRVQIAADATFSNMTNEQVISTCFWNEIQLPAGAYFWRVRIEEPAVARASWSQAQRMVLKPIIDSPMIPVVEEKYNEPEPEIQKKIERPVIARHPARVAPIVNAPVRMVQKKIAAAPAVKVAAPTREIASTESKANVAPKSNVIVPEIISPTRGARVAVGNSGRLSVVFTWTPVPEATDYLIEVAHDSEFKNIIDHHAVKPTKYLLRNKKFVGIVYWRVRTIGPSGRSQWSTPGSFEVSNSKVAQD